MCAEMTKEEVVADLKRHIFVFVWDDNAQPEAAERIKDAYERISSLEVSASWYQAQESLPSQDANFPTVFVMEQFNSTFYEEIKQDFRIIKPICLLTSLNKKVKIPISSCRSLANMALRKCRVSSSCFTSDQTTLIEQQVKLMGGIYTRMLLNNSTHLISDEVHSEKYSCAVRNDIQVVLRTWLDEAWNRSSSNPNFAALNREYTILHQCPVFMKCNVVVSGFSGAERDEIVHLLKSNRANYTKEIVMTGDSQTTHLVAKNPSCERYISAIKLSINIVRKDWVTNCVRKSCRLPEEDYLLESKPKIVATRIKTDTQSDAITEKLNQLDLEVETCEDFLDGFKIYLCGFNDSQSNRIKKILNLCKATRLNKLTANVTHVLFGSPNREQSTQVRNFSPAPSYILSLDWLVECWKQKCALSENEFLVTFTENDHSESRAKSSSSRRRRRESQSDNNVFSQYTRECNEDKILSNANFQLIDPNPSMLESIKHAIKKNGGNLITEDSTEISHYTIVPVDFSKYHDNTTLLVTLYWLECSIFAKRLLKPGEDPLFTPARDYGCANVLSDTIVLVIVEPDRYVKSVSIKEFLSYMGAINKDELRKTNPGRTELVVTETPNHEIARQAISWNIPVVKLDWVFQCALNKTRLSFEKFYASPSSQPSASPPRSFPSDRSKIFECDPAFELDLDDPTQLFPHGTTPRIIQHKSKGDNTQLAEMYSHNMESLFIRDFATKMDIPRSTPRRNVISDVLKGTKISFAIGFTPQEVTQMINIIHELGGEYCKSYSSQVTHYIYTAKSTWSKEAQLAKKDNAAVVHPQWLIHGKKSSVRLNVINYPPSFDPNNSIGYFKVEKCAEPDITGSLEPMDVSHSPDILKSYPVISGPDDEQTDNKSNLSISFGGATPNLLRNQEAGQLVTPTRSRKKRMRSPNIPIVAEPHSCNLFNIAPLDTDSTNVNVQEHVEKDTGSRFKDNLSTQEVYDNFEIIYREVKEPNYIPSDPLTQNDKLKSHPNAREYGFKTPRESRRFSSLYHKKEFLINNFSQLRETRERVGWDPLPSEDFSAPEQLEGDSTPDRISRSSTPESSCSERISSIRTSSRLRTSSSSKYSNVLSTSNSPLTSSQSNYYFMFSNVNMELKFKMNSIITSLGGKFSNGIIYENKCTHMISGEVITCEKIFCAMAAGVYVLKPEYIYRCERESQFVCEEPFEWGNPLNNSPTGTAPVNSEKKSLATYSWRKKLEEKSQLNRQSMPLRRPTRSAAFENWVVFLGCQSCKIKDCKSEICKRIILAGKGKTTNSLVKRSRITIALLDSHIVPNAPMKQLKESGIPVNLCRYLFEYLDNLGDETRMREYVC